MRAGSFSRLAPAPAMMMPPGLHSRRFAACGLFVGQMVAGSSAIAMCQNTPCWLPGDGILSSPLDFTSGPGSLLEQADRFQSSSEGGNASEVFIGTSANRTRKADTPDEDGYSSQSLGFQLGGLREITEDVIVAYSFAYDNSRQHTNDRLTRTDSELYYADLAMERRWHGWRFSGSVGLAHARHHMRRVMIRAPGAATGHGRADSHLAVLGTGVSYRFEGSDWYLEPKFGLALFYEHTPSHREHGLGEHDQHVKRSESMRAMLAPAIEFGKHAQLGKTELFYWASAGVNLLTDNTWTSHGHTSGRPDVTLTEVGTLPSAIGDFRTGLVLSGSPHWSLYAHYGLQIGSHYRSHSGTLRLAWAF